MRHVLRVATIAAVLTIPIVAVAGPEDGLVAAIRAAATSNDPARAFFAALPSDVELNAVDVQNCFRTLGRSDAAGPLIRVLASAQRVSRHGENVEIRLAQPAGFPIVVKGVTKGWANAERKVTFHLKKTGPNEWLIDEVEGLEVGEDRDSMRTVRSLTFTQEGAQPIVRLVASWGPFSGKRVFPIGEPPRPAGQAPVEGPPAGGRTEGLTDQIKPR